MVSLQGCRPSVLLVLGLSPLLLLLPACGLGGISVTLEGPATVQTGQTIVIGVGINYPVTPPCAVTITENGQSAPLATFGSPPSQIRYAIPANAPLGAYTILGTCTGIASAPVSLNITNPPKITEFGLQPASIGMFQQIQGTGFGASQGSGAIELLQLNGGPHSTQISAVTSWSDGRITLMLPTVPTGTYQLAVHTATNGDSAPVAPFTIGPAVQFLWVADTLNNRVVGFIAPITTGESFGPAFTQIGLLNPGGVATDPSHDLLWISDTGNNRVLQMSTPATLNENPNITLGQVSSCTASGPTAPATGPTFSGPIPPATSSTFSGPIPPATSSTFCAPTGIAVDTQGNLWVADTGNNRVSRIHPSLYPGSVACHRPGVTHTKQMYNVGDWFVSATRYSL
jgi:hypothetical protein